MAPDYETLMAIRLPRAPISYSERDAILYALAVGMGRDPICANELPFVFEGAGIKAMPTMATIFGVARHVTARAGIDHTRVVHAEQRLVLDQEMPAAGDFLMDEGVSGVVNKVRGALIAIERRISDPATGRRLWTVTNTLFVRGLTVRGAPCTGEPGPPAPPSRRPDASLALETRPEQALLYALCGDLNPLHRDPAVAKAAGFDRPILHGLCTFGIAGRALLSANFACDSKRVINMDARFVAPALPGDTLITDIWIDGALAAFRVTAQERNVVVLSNGRCALAKSV